MDGFGKFLNAVFAEATDDDVEAVPSWSGPGGYDSTMPEAGEGGRAVAYSYERYLAGGPRDLNINDL